MSHLPPELIKKLTAYTVVGLILDVAAVPIHFYAPTIPFVISFLMGLISFLLYRSTCQLLCEFKGRNRLWARLVWIIGPFAILVIANLKDGKEASKET
jgi:hypothetical protein